MVCRSLHQGSVSKCGSQDTVRREMWLQKGHHVIHCSQCAQQDKVESEQWVAAKESPPWQPGHSIRSSCQENMLEIHPCSGRSVSSKIGPSQRAGIQSPIRADRSDRDLQGQSQAVGSGMGTGSVDIDTEAEAQTPLSPRGSKHLTATAKRGKTRVRCMLGLTTSSWPHRPYPKLTPLEGYTSLLESINF